MVLGIIGRKGLLVKTKDERLEEANRPEGRPYTPGCGGQSGAFASPSEQRASD